MQNIPHDLERLIHESLEQIGWNADPKEIASRIKRLNIGLPLEDEFSIICGWLGKCLLVHKLDQQQYPETSKTQFQIPDLLARFKSSAGKEYTVLIEVKSSNKNVMSFTPAYLKKLKAYGEILGVPVLIAWKKYSLWTLVSLDEFKIATKNYNLRFIDALKNSLLGVLAGDFSYTPEVNSGIHLIFRKEHLVNSCKSEDETVESWNTILEDVYFTNGKNEEIRDLSPIAQQLFHSWDLDEDQSFTDTHLGLHFVVKEESSLFAHMALTRLLCFHTNGEEELHWRQHLSDHSKISTIHNFRKGIEENLNKGVVRYIFDVLPQKSPDFIK